MHRPLSPAEADERLADVPRMATTEQAADVLDVTVQTVRGWIRTGRIRAYGILSRTLVITSYRVPVDELRRLLTEPPDVVCPFCGSDHVEQICGASRLKRSEGDAARPVVKRYRCGDRRCGRRFNHELRVKVAESDVTG